MKIKVLHVVLSMETGGLENGIVNLVNQSNQEDYCVDILCLRARGELANRVSKVNSQVIFDGDESHSLITAIKKIYKACKLGKYQIIHSHGFTTMLASYIAGKLAGTQIIMNGEHGTIYHASKKSRIMQKYLFKKMALNLTVSKELKTRIKEAFDIDYNNFHTIINGVDTEKFKPNPLIKSKLKQKLNIQPDDIIIGSVGRLVEVKNYKSLVDACSLIFKKHHNIHLVLAGDGPERKLLENQISQYDLSSRIHLLGRRDDIPNIMNLLDIFVLPSFSEGLSNTLLEAMSCGTPVIASDVGGNSEIVVPNSGYLYQSDNTEELSTLLKDLVNDKPLIDRLSVQAREHILRNYSIDRMVDNYETTYFHLFNGLEVTNISDELT